MHAADGGYGHAAARPSCMNLAAAHDEMPANVRADFDHDPATVTPSIFVHFSFLLVLASSNPDTCLSCALAPEKHHACQHCHAVFED